MLLLFGFELQYSALQPEETKEKKRDLNQLDVYYVGQHTAEKCFWFAGFGKLINVLGRHRDREVTCLTSELIDWSVTVSFVSHGQLVNTDIKNKLDEG